MKRRDKGFGASADVKRRRDLDDEVRRQAPGQFVPLSDGVTYYEIAEPAPASVRASARPVVLIHGFSVPSFLWDPTVDALTEAGFRVVRYDLFGRGYSDRPRARYNLELFDHQLRDLVSALALDVPVDLVGLSMGGAIAVGFTNRHPALVRRLVLIDPAGYELHSPGLALLRVPLLGELLMATVGRRVLMSGLSDDIDARNQEKIAPQLAEMAQRYMVQTRYKGFWHALLSTIRHGPVRDMAEAYARVGRQDRRILLLWGREDRTVPFELSSKVRKDMPRAEFHAIDGAAHAPHLERPVLVNRFLIEFLKGR